MARDLLFIVRFLQRLRLRSALLALLELALVSGSVAIGLLLLAGALGGLGWVHSLLPPLFWTLLIASPLAWLLRVLWPRYRPLHRLTHAARYVDTQVPTLRNATLSAVELSHEGTLISGSSEALLQAAVARTAVQIRDLSTTALLPARVLRPWLVTCILLLLVVAGAEQWRPGQLAANMHRFLHPPSARAIQTTAPPEQTAQGPALGDIRLTLVYPAYLNRQTENLENASGEILAPVGTQITISARAAFHPQEAVLEITSDDGQQPMTTRAQLEDSGRFSAAFIVDATGTYRFILSPTSGDPIISRPYPIKIEEDGPPTIEILGLEPVTEITPNQPVTFAFLASDDHGVTRVDLVVEGPEGSKRKNIQEFSPSLDRADGDLSWYPNEWDVQKGGSVQLWLETFDDDTVNGPKVGRSDRYKMVLSSQERRRAQVLASKEALKEALLVALGDGLVEHAIPLESKGAADYARETKLLSSAFEKVRSSFGKLREMMEEDLLEERVVYRSTLALEQEIMEAWEALETGLQERTSLSPTTTVMTSVRALYQRRSYLIDRLERGILSMESFANMQRMEGIMASGQELRSAGEDLKDLLEALKKSGQSLNLEEIQKKLNQMDQKLAQMAKQLQKLDRTSAEWFQNPNAEAKEVQDTLAKIRKLLEQGKTEEAMKMLDEYLKATDEMMKALEAMQNQEFGDNRQEMVKDMEGTIDGIKAMEQQQQQLLQDTEAIKKSLMAEAGLTGEALQALTEEALKKLAEMQTSQERAQQAAQRARLRPDPEMERRGRELSDRMRTLEAALKAKDISLALRVARKTVRNFRMLDVDLKRQRFMGGGDMTMAREHAKAGRRTGDALARDLEEWTERMDRAQAQGAMQGEGLADRQQSLRRQGQEMSQRLREYSEGSPMIPERWGEQMGRAAQSMYGAEGKLEDGKLRGGAADEQIALKELSELRGELESVQQEMAQRTRGIPRQGRPMPGMEGQTKRQQSERWGGRGIRAGKVDISQDFQAPEAYRREIMEGMRGETPARYKRLNREYYEKLVR